MSKTHLWIQNWCQYSLQHLQSRFLLTHPSYWYLDWMLMPRWTYNPICKGLWEETRWYIVSKTHLWYKTDISIWYNTYKVSSFWHVPTTNVLIKFFCIGEHILLFVEVYGKKQDGTLWARHTYYTKLTMMMEVKYKDMLHLQNLLHLIHPSYWYLDCNLLFHKTILSYQLFATHPKTQWD